MTKPPEQHILSQEPEPPEGPRKAAEYTLDKLDAYIKSQGGNLSEEKRGRPLAEWTRNIWKEFAVHGLVDKDRKTGEYILGSYSDLDGEFSMFLLREAGLDPDIKYVNKEEWIENRINVDTGDRYRLTVEGGPDAKTVFLDHHGPEAKNDTCAAKITYETLTTLGLLKKAAN